MPRVDGNMSKKRSCGSYGVQRNNLLSGASAWHFRLSHYCLSVCFSQKFLGGSSSTLGCVAAEGGQRLLGTTTENPQFHQMLHRRPFHQLPACGMIHSKSLNRSPSAPRRRAPTHRPSVNLQRPTALLYFLQVKR